MQLSRRDIKLYQDLGKRYDSLGNAKETERAYTSIVEVQPNESESHAMLADIRQHQNRWSEAADCWQQVAKIRALEPTGLLKLAARRSISANGTPPRKRCESWMPRPGLHASRTSATKFPSCAANSKSKRSERRRIKE